VLRPSWRRAAARHQPTVQRWPPRWLPDLHPLLNARTDRPILVSDQSDTEHLETDHRRVPSRSFDQCQPLFGRPPVRRGESRALASVL
jgi:hypothetical protein